MQSMISTYDKKGSLNWTRFNSSFIIEIKRGNEVFTSTAVAIGKRLLATAAHCVDCAEDVVVIIGDDYQAPETVVGAAHWVVHPSYNPKKSFYEDDIALIYLDEDLPHFTSIESLNFSGKLSDKSFLERIGFGGRGNENVRTWTNPSFESITFNNKNFVLRDTLSVIGDSGGPVYKEENGVLKLVGIHSTKEGDNKTYVVNIHHYKNWIEGHLAYEEVI